MYGEAFAFFFGKLCKVAIPPNGSLFFVYDAQKHRPLFKWKCDTIKVNTPLLMGVSLPFSFLYMNVSFENHRFRLFTATQKRKNCVPIRVFFPPFSLSS